MPSTSTLVTFVLVAAAFAAMPGPSNLYVTAQGLRAGRRSALAAAVGCSLAAATYVGATVLGLAALLASSAALLSTLHYVGGGYLLFLAVRAFRADGERIDPARRSSDGERRSLPLGRGFLTELTNPKVALFFLAFFPQFVHRGDGPVAGQLVVLGVVFCLIGLLSDSLYALASGTLRHRIDGRRRLLVGSTRASGLLYLGLGAWSIWSGARVQSS